MSRRAPAALLAARLVYSMQWYVLAPAMVALLMETNARVSYSGLLPMAFIAGAAAFQLLGPYISSRAGAKNAYLAGLFVVSAADIIVGLARNFAEVLVARTVAGLGAALFFAPAAYVLLELGGLSSVTLLSLYELSFNLGGLLGISWGLLDGLLGWRAGTELAGVIGLIMVAVNFTAVNSNPHVTSISYSLASAGRRDLLWVSLAGAGAFGTSYALGSLLPEAAHIIFRAPEYSVALETAVYFIGNVIGSLVLLIIKLKASSARSVAVSFLAMSLSFIALTVPSYGLFLAVVAINGAATGAAFALYYSYVTDKFSQKNSTTTLAFINMVNMIGSLFVYPIAGMLLERPIVLWTFMAASTIAPLAFLLPIRQHTS